MRIMKITGDWQMGAAGESAGSRSGVTAFWFFVLLFSYPVCSLLWRRTYPFFATEVLTLIAVFLGMSIFLGFLVTRTRPAVDNLLTGFLVLLVFTVQFNLFLEGMIICAVAIALLMLVFKHNFRKYGLTVLAALLLGAFLDSRYVPQIDRPEAVAVQADAKKPLVLHIVLDGFIGPAGLPPYPASDLIREKILSFLLDNNFQLFSHAYSRYASTSDSINAVMNYRHDAQSEANFGGEDHSAYILEENAFFNSLEQLGYRLNVYQTGHLDLCRSNPDSLDQCWQYDHPNINSVLHADKMLFRLHSLLTVLFSQSKVLTEVLTRHKVIPNPLVAVYDPRIFDALKKDISLKKGGNYFFAHALIPHGPYAYQPDCSVSYDNPGWLRTSFIIDEPLNSPIIYEIRNGLYFAQVECALRSVQSLFDEMKKQGLYDRSIIILHGDHGSQIVQHNPMVSSKAVLSPQEYRSIFSALFAVKFPGSEFAVDERALPLPFLFEEFSALLPSLVAADENVAPFNPSTNASPEKTDSYVYLAGTFPLDRVAIDLFKDVVPVQEAARKPLQETGAAAPAVEKAAIDLSLPPEVLSTVNGSENSSPEKGNKLPNLFVIPDKSKQTSYNAELLREEHNPDIVDSIEGMNLTIERKLGD